MESVILVASVLLGICSLLLTTTADQGLINAVARAHTTLTVSVPATDDAQERLASTKDVIAQVFSPLTTDQTSWATTSTLYLPRLDSHDDAHAAYLGAYQEVQEHASLLSGRWARASTGTMVEAAIPGAAAARFDLHIGDTIALSTASNTFTATVTVVGLYEALDPGGAYWSHDRLAGQGYNPEAPLKGAARPRSFPTAGAFLVSDQMLGGHALAFASITVAAAPRVEDATAEQVTRAAAGVAGARDALRQEVDAKATAFSSFPEAVAAAKRHTEAAQTIIVIALLMVVAVALTALVLAARLLSVRRVRDAELLASRGATIPQIASTSVGESVVLGALGALAGPPLAWCGYLGLVSIPWAADAGLSPPAGLTAPLWLTCAAVAIVVVALLIALGAHSPAPVRQPRRGALARSGIDVVLVLAAALGVIQLTMYGTPTVEGHLDVILAFTPVACIVAGAAVSVRAVPLIGAVVSRWLPRTSALVTPLALWNIARRPQRSSGAVFLVTLAVAASTFAPGFIATWRVSQVDQADLAVGTDVRVDTITLPIAIQGATIAAAAHSSPSPVARDRVALGSTGAAIMTQQSAQILGIDASRPGLLRGRLETGSWEALTAPLAATVELGPMLTGTPDSLTLTMTGDVTLPDAAVAGTATAPELVATVTAMVRDAHGATWPLPLPAIDLDGTEHQVSASLSGDSTSDGAHLSYPLTIEALVADLDLASGYRPHEVVDGAQVTLAMSAGGAFDGADLAGQAVPWTATVPRQSASSLAHATVTDATDAALTSHVTVTGAAIGHHGARLVLTPYDVPATVPVVISSTLAAQISAEPGSTFAITVPGGGAIDAAVTAVADALPSLPTEPAIMIDLQTYTRSSIADGAMVIPMTGWQLEATPAQQLRVQSALEQAHVGTVTSRASRVAQLLDSPSRVGVQLAAVLVAVAGVTLGIAGYSLHLSAALDGRRPELARLFGLGLSQRALRRAIVLESALVGLLAGVFGGLVGGLTNALVSARLTISPTGGVPVPAALTVWPWPVEAGIIAVGATLFAVVVLARARRSCALVRTDVQTLGDDS